MDDHNAVWSNAARDCPTLKGTQKIKILMLFCMICFYHFITFKKLVYRVLNFSEVKSGLSCPSCTAVKSDYPRKIDSIGVNNDHSDLQMRVALSLIHI